STLYFGFIPSILYVQPSANVFAHSNGHLPEAIEHKQPTFDSLK
ncbi:MAG: hypothetical protein ACI84C_001256, partial [Flavobacteriales bacterium]